MWDNILDFIEDHKTLCIFLAVLLILVIVAFGIRHHNLSKKESQDSELFESTTEVESITEEISVVEESTEESSFTSNVGLQVTEEESEEVESIDSEALKYKEEQILDVFCNVIGHTVVPATNMDGSSCKGYLKKVSINDFDTYFGSTLTSDDLHASDYILVGTSSEKDGDLKSTGWLQANLNTINGNTPVYFTNLHVVGSLSDERVVLLCSYDWYSAFGLKDTLVLFEDISGTLNVDDYIDGDIISTVVWGKNIKIEKVAGQNVVHIEYATES